MAAGKRCASEADRDIGGRVREARLLGRCSQVKLAKDLGVSVSQMQKYESGQDRISASGLSRVAEILGFSIAFFFGPGQPDARTAPQPRFDPVKERVMRHLGEIEDGEVMKRLVRLIGTLASANATSRTGQVESGPL